MTLGEYAILRFVAANPDMPEWIKAKRCRISQRVAGYLLTSLTDEVMR
jgi:hypothetical protein